MHKNEKLFLYFQDEKVIWEFNSKYISSNDVSMTYEDSDGNALVFYFLDLNFQVFDKHEEDINENMIPTHFEVVQSEPCTHCNCGRGEVLMYVKWRGKQ